MEGAALKSEREYDLTIVQEWHGAKFNALAQAGKLRGLKSYLSKAASKTRPTAAAAVAFFHALKARGIPVEITRTPRKPVGSPPQSPNQ